MAVNYGNPERENHLVYDREFAGHTPQFGGIYGLASSLANQYGNQAEGMKNRVIGNAYSSQDTAVESQARAQQAAALEQQRRMSLGLDPSVAEQQYRQGLLNSYQGQRALAQSALGGGSNMALAQRSAAANNVNNGIQGEQAAAMIRAQEMAAARERYAAGLQNMRGADQSMWGAMQGRELGQASLNDQGVLGSQGMANNILGGQLNADSAAYAADAATKQARDKARRDNQYAMSKAVVGGVMNAGVGVITGGAYRSAGSDAQKLQQQQQDQQHGGEGV